MSNIVAIVGRPNVGKSTLFNRLVEQRQAIMDNQSGVTRDRHYGRAEWQGVFFNVVDTGGFVSETDDLFEKAIATQVKLAVEEADVVLFMVDVVTGLTAADQEIANILRQYKKTVILVANKSDNFERQNMSHEFYALKMGDPMPISAVSGSGTGDLLDATTAHLQPDSTENPDEGIARVAIVGQPNVGKSSLVNLLLGTERNIVTSQAGTTRDAIDSRYTAFGHEIILTDTAGLRRKKKVTDNIEFYSVMRAIKAIENSDVAVVMIDAAQGLVSQDMNIIQLAINRKKGVVILVNKWDTVEKDTNTIKNFKKELDLRLGEFNFIPVVFISVLNKQRVLKAVEKIVGVYQNKQKRIATSKLNQLLLPEIERTPPPSVRGYFINIKYITQIPGRTPAFAFFCNYPQHVKEAYKRFLENKLRSKFDFEGVTIQIFFRKK